MGRLDCPPAIKQCKVVLNKMSYTTQTNEDNISPSKLEAVPSQFQDILGVGNKYFSFTRFNYKGVKLTTLSFHRGNSQIMFSPYPGCSPIPGFIQYIYGRNCADVEFVVQRCREIPERCDPFRFYRDFPAKVYSIYLSSMEVIKLEQLDCHFASYQIDESTQVVLSLGRVSLLFDDDMFLITLFPGMNLKSSLEMKPI